MVIFRKNCVLFCLLLLLTNCLLISQATAEQQNDKLFLEAKKKFNQKSFEQAAKLFEQYIAANQEGQYLAESYYHLAELQEDFNKTVVFYRKIILEFPKSTLVDDAYYRLGMTHFLLNDYETALTDFQKLLADFPTSSHADKAQYQLGKTRLSLNQVSDAKTAFQKLLTEYPGSSETSKAILGLAECLRKENKEEEALHELLAFLKLYPKSDLEGQAFFSIAESYRVLGNNTQADIFYQNVINLYPDSFEAEEARKRILRTQENSTFFSVQLGAFSVQDNAVRLQKRMLLKGYKDVYLKILNKGDKTLNLVLIGHFKNKTAAEKILKSIKREVRISPRIILVKQNP